MLKRVMIICMLIISMSMVGCQIDQGVTTIVAQTLSEREQYLLKLTQNNVLIYDIKNLPQDKNYEVEIVYEVYQEGEKIKEQVLTAIYNDADSEKGKKETIALNIQQDEISYVWGENGFASGGYDLEEDLSKYSQSWFGNTANLEINSEVYIYHAYSGSSSLNNIMVGNGVTEEELNRVLNSNIDNIFIKIVLKQI